MFLRIIFAFIRSFSEPLRIVIYSLANCYYALTRLFLARLNLMGETVLDGEELVEYIHSLVVRDYGGSQASFAKAIGISRSYLNEVLRFQKGPGPKILKAIGVEEDAACKTYKTYRLKTLAG